MPAQPYSAEGVRYELTDEAAMLETLQALQPSGFRGGVYLDGDGAWTLELQHADKAKVIEGARVGDAIASVGPEGAAIVWKETGNATA